MSQQNYGNHTRIDPSFHFLVVPLALFVLGYCAWMLYRAPGWDRAVALVASVALILIALKARMYALQVQDRVIRLEETLRLRALGGSEAGLGMKQFVGLRFATDNEVAALAERAVREKLTPKQIKQAVQQWRPDTERV